MGTDYRKLCLELFGTDDEKELRRIAEKLHRSNSRNAGRKKKFTPAEAEQMERLQARGVSQQEIALALKGVDVENLKLEEIIKQALKKMAMS